MVLEGSGGGDGEAPLARLPLALFACVAGPLCVLIGASTALIGFTAWSLMVPLALTGLGVSALDAIFMSMVCDGLDALLLAALLARSGRVHYPSAAALGVPAAVLSAAAASTLSRPVVDAHEALLKGSVPVALFVFGAAFLFRAVRTHRAFLASERARADAGEPIQAVYRTIGDGDGDGDGCGQRLRPLTRGRVLALAAGVVLGSAVAGTLGPGLAMAYVGLLVAVRGMDLVEATATAAFVQLASMAGTVSAYAARGYPDYGAVRDHLAVCASFCLAGVALGTAAALRIRRRFVLIYAVAATLFALGTGAVLQKEYASD